MSNCKKIYGILFVLKKKKCITEYAYGWASLKFPNHCCINVSKCTLSVIGDWVKIRWSIFTYRPNKCKLKCTKLCVCVCVCIQCLLSRDWERIDSMELDIQSYR